MRIAIRIIAGTFGLDVVVALLLLMSAHLSLDQEQEHTRHTEALRIWAPDVSDGLVEIRARGMMFRARVAGLDQEEAVAAGFRVLAFDHRRYNPGARPDGVESYELDEAVADLFAVASVIGLDRFHSVVHDWGSIAGWLATAESLDRVLTYASLSIPHPSAVSDANVGEGVPSYDLFFQTSALVGTFLFALDSRMLRGRKSEMPASRLAECLAAFSEPGAMTAALNWYRARRQFVFGEGFIGEVVQPVHFVTGSKKLPFIVRPENRILHPTFVTGPLKVVDVDVGHWLMQEETELVVEAVMTHLVAQATPLIERSD